MRQITSSPSLLRVPDAGAADSRLWTVFRALREARGQMGLRPHHLNTLAALISFLRPDSGTVVFASNRSILERLNGACERTLQRHIQDLVGHGLVTRCDSSNKKRFRLRAADEILAFGLDLSPLLNRSAEITAIAEEAQATRARIALIRQRILQCLAERKTDGIMVPDEREISLALRRKPRIEVLESIAASLKVFRSSVPSVEGAGSPSPADRMSPSLSPDVGHYHKSEDKRPYETGEITSVRHRPVDRTKLIKLISSSCGDAVAWLDKDVLNWSNLLRKTPELASWIGIHRDQYVSSEKALGPERTAATLMGVLQLGSHILNPGAYFHSITLGSRSGHFDVERWLLRLRSKKLAVER